jgi:hypothetical protein
MGMGLYNRKKGHSELNHREKKTKGLSNRERGAGD